MGFKEFRQKHFPMPEDYEKEDKLSLLRAQKSSQEDRLTNLNIDMDHLVKRDSRHRDDIAVREQIAADITRIDREIKELSQ